MLQPKPFREKKDSIEQTTGAEQTTHEPDWGNLASDDEQKMVLTKSVRNA